MTTKPSNPSIRVGVWPRIVRHRVIDEQEDRGHLQLFLPTPELCVSMVTGHLSQRMAQRWIETMDPHFRRGVVFVTFHDWENMSSYDSAARRALTTWIVSNTKSIKSARFLVGSKLVAMGVSAASLATALVGLKMVADSSRDAFETELEAAFERA